MCVYLYDRAKALDGMKGTSGREKKHPEVDAKMLASIKIVAL